MTGRDSSSAGGVTPVFITARLELTVAIPDGSSPEDVARLVDGMRARVLLSHEDADLRSVLDGGEPDDLHVSVRPVAAPDGARPRGLHPEAVSGPSGVDATPSASATPPELDFSSIGFSQEEGLHHPSTDADALDMRFPESSDFAAAHDARPSGSEFPEDERRVPAAGAGVSSVPSSGGSPRRAVIALSSGSKQAEGMFRTAVVSIDAIPGNQVEGISPLYHVANLDGPDGMAAVVQTTTRLDAAGLVRAIESIAAGQEGGLALSLVDMEDAGAAERGVLAPDATRRSAAVLAPWLDMDPDARLGDDPVSYLLALASDADRVGMLSDDWILGRSGGISDGGRPGTDASA